MVKWDEEAGAEAEAEAEASGETEDDAESEAEGEAEGEAREVTRLGRGIQQCVCHGRCARAWDCLPSPSSPERPISRQVCLLLRANFQHAAAQGAQFVSQSGHMEWIQRCVALVVDLLGGAVD